MARAVNSVGKITVKHPTCYPPTIILTLIWTSIPLVDLVIVTLIWTPNPIELHLISFILHSLSIPELAVATFICSTEKQDGNWFLPQFEKLVTV